MLNLSQLFFSPSNKGKRRQHSYRPRLERLEDRLAPAVDIWTGAGGGLGNWSNRFNWQGNVAPSPGDDLVFTGTTTQNNLNDFSPGTAFNSITLLTNGWLLNGNSIVVSNGINAEQTAFNTTNTINLATILLADPQTIFSLTPFTTLTINSLIDMGSSALTIDGAGNTTVAGALDGISATGVIKNGTGRASLTNSFNNYQGSTAINAGELLTNQNNSLGGVGAVTVANGASLVLSGATFNQFVTISGQGFGGTGAIDCIANTTLSGVVNMVGDSTIAVNPAAVSLTCNATSALSGTGNLTVEGLGQLLFQNAMSYNGSTTINGSTLTLNNNGAITSTSITVNRGGTLNIDDSSGTPPNPVIERLPGTPNLFLNDSSQLLYKIKTGGILQLETLGTIHLGAGRATIQVVDAATTTSSSSLVAAGLVQDDPAAGVQFQVTGTVTAATAFGAAGNQVNFTTPPTLVNGILPWATIVDVNGVNFYSYNPTATSNVPGTPTGSVAACGVAGSTGQYVTTATLNNGTENLKLSGGVTTINLTATTNVNSLLLNATAAGTLTINTAGFGLTVGSGGILCNGVATDNVQIQGGGPGINFGTSNGVFSVNADILTVSAVPIAGSAGITKTLAGTLTLQGFSTPGPANTYTGVTSVWGSTLNLSEGADGVVAIPGDLVIGDSQSVANSAAVVMNGHSGQIAAASNVTVNASGFLNLQTFSDTIHSLTLTPGYVSANVTVNTPGILTLAGGGVTLSPSVATSFTLVPPALIQGTGFLSLGGLPETFAIFDGAAVNDLVVNTFITDAGGGSLTKTGLGTLVFGNANTYSGATNVNAGTLIENKNNPFSAINVAAGAALGGGLTTTATTVGPITLLAGAFIQPGNVASPTGAAASNPVVATFNIPPRGILTTNSGLNLSAGANAVIQVAPPAVGTAVAGTDFDQINVQGPLTLAGTSTLTVDLSGAVVAGSVLKVFTFSSLTGQFNTVNVINNPFGFNVVVVYKGTEIDLDVTNPGTNSIAVSAGSPQSATVNTNFATNLAAIVTDQFGNPVYGVTVNFVAPGSGPSGSFSGSPTPTNTSGVATAQTFKANTKAGVYTVTATATGVNGTASFSLTNTPDTASETLSFVSGSPQSGTVGTQLANPLIVQILDQYSNPFSGVTVHWAAATGGGSVSADQQHRSERPSSDQWHPGHHRRPRYLHRHRDRIARVARHL